VSRWAVRTRPERMASVYWAARQFPVPVTVGPWPDTSAAPVPDTTSAQALRRPDTIRQTDSRQF